MAKFKLKFIKIKITFKEVIKTIILKQLTKLVFLESLLKYSNGIGFVASLETEVRFLLNTDSNAFILFDIGANVGDFSKIVSKKYPRSRIYSFEPSKFTFKLLTSNVIHNKNIEPINAAFGERNKKMILYSNQNGSGMASLYNRGLENTGIKLNKRETVEVFTLDNWVKSNKVIPDYIKIDVEGSEFSVLKGGLNTLKHVKAVQFEFGGTAIDARKYFKDYWNLFNSLNFTIYRYTPSGLKQITKYSEKEECFEYMNYVAISHKHEN